MFLRARLVVESRSDVVFVPERAVTQHGDGYYVMVLDGVTARRRPVTPGLRGDNGWEIGGVEAGERIVVEGHFGLPDGATVRLLGLELAR
jgi:multidrug efflux pump subunit AcrA (membrane-fusion protein)